MSLLTIGFFILSLLLAVISWRLRHVSDEYRVHKARERALLILCFRLIGELPDPEREHWLAGLVRATGTDYEVLRKEAEGVY